MRNISLWLLAFLLVPALVLTGIGCGQNEETEDEEQQEESEQTELLEEAGIEQAGWEASVPGYWTMTIVAEDGEIDANLAFFDDGTAQGLFGEARTSGITSHISYGTDSNGTWSIDGDQIILLGGTASNISGMMTSETTMTGSITDASGSTYPWHAIKTGELDRVLSMRGTWMIEFEIDGQHRYEQLECAANGLCEVVWEKYQGGYEGAPGSERFYTWHHQGGSDLRFESTDNSLSHNLGAEWNDDWGGWEVDGNYTTDDGRYGDSGGIKMGDL
jgi:hypothetical protein